MLNDADVEMVKGSVTMIDLARAMGYKPNSAGFIQCPFHTGDDTGSMKLYGGRRGFYCFGCHEGGDIIKFVRLAMNMGFEDAVRYIAGLFHITITEKDDRPDEESIRAAKDRAEIRRLERALETAIRRSKEAELRTLSSHIHRCESMLEKVEPMGDIWCRLIDRHQMLDARWHALFDEIYGRGAVG